MAYFRVTFSGPATYTGVAVDAESTAEARHRRLTDAEIAWLADARHAVAAALQAPHVFD